jgi:hypothetical protein
VEHFTLRQRMTLTTKIYCSRLYNKCIDSKRPTASVPAPTLITNQWIARYLCHGNLHWISFLLVFHHRIVWCKYFAPFWIHPVYCKVITSMQFFFRIMFWKFGRRYKISSVIFSAFRWAALIIATFLPNHRIKKNLTL